MVLALRIRIQRLDRAFSWMTPPKLDEEVYMKQPEGFVEGGHEGLVCRLKQPPKCWNSTVNTHLKKLGFLQCNSHVSM